MDRIDLPLISGNPTLDEVFDRMAESGMHAAIVAPAGGEPVLVKNHDVSDGLENGLRRVDQIPVFPLRVVQAEAEDWEGELEKSDASYGTVAERGWTRGGGDDADDGGGDDGGTRWFGVPESVSMVTIVTRHETLAAEIRNAGAVCLCVNRHRVPGGRPCPICSKAVRCA